MAKEANKSLVASKKTTPPSPSILKKKVVSRKKVKIVPRPTAILSNPGQNAEVLPEKSPATSPATSSKIKLARLYVRFRTQLGKTNYKTKADLMAIHPNITRVILPRRGELAKFFYVIFDSEEKAHSALRELRQRGDCYVKLAFTTIEPRTELPHKENDKTRKEKMRKLWA